MRHRLIYFVIALTAICCREPEDEPLSVFGKVTNYSQNGSGIEVVLENEDTRYSTVADAEGNNRIQNVDPFDYFLKVTQMIGDSITISKQVYVDLETGSVNVDVALPDSVRLLNPLHASNQSITLQWTSPHDEYFTEYRIYEYSPYTGDVYRLVYTGTSQVDTIYKVIDYILGNARYDFRVHAIGKYGTIAVSNLLKTSSTIYPDYPELYRLEEVANFAAPSNGVMRREDLTSITSDGTSLWFLFDRHYSDPTLYYQFTDSVFLSRYDIGEKRIIETHKYSVDSLYFPLDADGVAADANNRFWISGWKAGTMQVNPRLGSFTFQRPPSFAGGFTYFKDQLYFWSYVQINRANPDTYQTAKAFNTVYPSDISGIVGRNNEIWLFSVDDNPDDDVAPREKFAIVYNETGPPIGFVKLPHRGMKCVFIMRGS